MSDAFSPKEWILVSKRNASNSHSLHREMLFVGRQECDIVIDSPSIESRHCVFCFNPEERKFFVKDLGTTHGTFVNDSRLPSQSYIKLEHQDSLKLGFSAEVFVITKRSLLNESAAPENDASVESISYSLLTTKLNNTSESSDCYNTHSSATNNLSTCPTTYIHPVSSSHININDFLSDVDSDKIMYQQKNSKNFATEPSVTEDFGSSSHVNKSQIESQKEENSRKSPISMAMSFTISFDDSAPVKKKKPVLPTERIKRSSPKPVEQNVKPCESKTTLVKKSNGRMDCNSLPMQTELQPGQLSDSAAYLIHRMLASEPANTDAENDDSAVSTSSKELETPSSGEKDSGVCDDKSEAGTYTLALEKQDAVVEQARHQIDQVFGVESPDISENNSLATLCTARTFWKNQCQSPTEQAKVVADHKHGMEFRQGTFTRGSRRGSAESSELNTSSTIKRNQPKIINERASTSQARPNIEAGSRSPRSVRSAASGKKYAPFSPLARRKSTDIRVNESDSSDHESLSSSKCKSDSQSNSGLKLNRAFALRRARLGIDTPGVQLNLSKDKPKKPEVAPNRIVSGLNRSDGGRFSLRMPRASSTSSSKPPTGLASSRSSSKDELQRRGSTRTPSEIKNVASRYLGNKATPAAHEPRPVYSLYSPKQTSNTPIQRSSSFGARKVQNYSNRSDASDRLMRGLPTQVTKRVQSAQNSPAHGSEIHHVHHPTVINLPAKRPDQMSASMIDRVNRDSPESLESPLSMRAPKSRELSALDTLVISAILQLSHKLRCKLRECLEHERSKYQNDSETKMLIDEILPQVSSVESRLHDGSETGLSKDLSNILKNLKKVEQSIDVLNLLNELDPSSESCAKDNLIVERNLSPDEY